MGVTTHFKYAFKGTKTELMETMKTLRKGIMKLPVILVGRIHDIKAARVESGFAIYKDKRFHEYRLGMMMSFNAMRDFNSKKTDYEKRLKIIEEMGNGIGFRVNVAEGSEYFQVMLARFGESDEWHGRGFTKISCARDPQKAHDLVIAMLDICKEAGILESIHDEW